MSLLGIIASSKLVAVGDFESIATVSLSSSAANVEFTSIPATYTHLQVRAIFRNTNESGGGNEQFLRMQCNSDTTANYSWQYLQGNGGAASAADAISQTEIEFNYPIPMSNDLANTFGVGIIDVLDYKNTNKYKTVRALAGVNCNGSTSKLITFSSGLWQSTSAITSIKFYPKEDNFSQYSQFALYGIKGA